MTKKIALVTGATSGIGEATAILLAENGYNLIVTGRRRERLHVLQQTIQTNSDSKVLPLCFDIRNREQLTRCIESIDHSWKNVDVLINNAGLAAGSASIDQADVDDWEQMIDTNIKGLLYLTRLITPGMIKRGRGHIVNLSSIAGKDPYPGGTVYCGTKHAVQAISQAMRIELAPFDIRVTTVAPGAVDTEFSLVRFKGDATRARKVYEGFTPLFARDVAETILFAVSRPAYVNIDDILIMPTRQATARDIFRTSTT